MTTFKRSARYRRGFTLIEVLVVLLVMGLCVGLVSAIVRPDDRGMLALEAERLAQLLDLAAEEARLTGSAIAWTSDGSGYRFWRLGSDTDWSELRENDLLRARTLPGGMTIANFQIDDAPAHGTKRLVFASFIPANAFTIELSLGTARYAITSSPIGTLRVFPVQGGAHGVPAQR